MKARTAYRTDEEGNDVELSLLELSPGTEGFKALCQITRNASKQGTYRHLKFGSYNFCGSVVSKIVDGGGRASVLVSALVEMAILTANGPKVVLKTSKKDYTKMQGLLPIIKALSEDVKQFKVEEEERFAKNRRERQILWERRRLCLLDEKMDPCSEESRSEYPTRKNLAKGPRNKFIGLEA